MMLNVKVNLDKVSFVELSDDGDLMAIIDGHKLEWDVGKNDRIELQILYEMLAEKRVMRDD